MPRRIQRKRTKGWRMPEGVVYVGRPTKYGNPFGADAKALESYRKWIELWLREDKNSLRDLRGKDLACWCKEGQPCHADILLELANQ